MTRWHAPPRIASALAFGALAALLASRPASPALAARADSWDPVERADGAAPVSVLVGGKPRVYFEVTAKRPLEISVIGPARVRVVTRAVVGTGTPPPVSYSVKVTAAGALLGEARTETSPARGVRRRDGKGVLCKSRSVFVSVPSGVRRISIAVEGAPKVLTRVLVASPRREAGARMISLTPIEAARSVTISEGEKLIPYYTTRIGRPVRFRIIGPTSLEITSRLDFDATMRGAQRYRLGLRVAGGPAREEAFTTTKAVAASYTDLKDRVPSKIDRVVLTLGEGSKDVAIVLLSPKHGAAEIHVRIPRPSAGNEERR